MTVGSRVFCHASLIVVCSLAWLSFFMSLLCSRPSTAHNPFQKNMKRTKRDRDGNPKMKLCAAGLTAIRRGLRPVPRDDKVLRTAAAEVSFAGTLFSSPRSASALASI